MFTVNVDVSCVRSLSIGLDQIETILLFSMENGGDKFISIKGDFKPSCFGLTLEELSRLENTPIRELKPAQVREACCQQISGTENNSSASVPIPEEAKAAASAAQLISLQPSYIQNFTQAELDILGLVPKELYKLCNSICNPKTLKKNTEIFIRNPPGAKDAREVIDQLDTGRFGDKLVCKSQHGIAEQFLVFLSALPEKVIPRSYYVLILDHSDTLENANKALRKTPFPDLLPKVHKAAFLYVMSTLKHLLSQKDTNMLTEEFVCTLFSSLLLVPPDSMVREVPLNNNSSHKKSSNNLINVEEEDVVGFDWALAKRQAKMFIRHYIT